MLQEAAVHMKKMAAGQEARVDILAQNIVVTKLFLDKLDCRVFRTLLRWSPWPQWISISQNFLPLLNSRMVVCI